MSRKNKNTNNTAQRLEMVFSHAALGAMAVATMLSTIHLPENREAKGLPAMQPVYAVAGEAGVESSHESGSRHQRLEEIRHPHASYGSTMRSHPTAGSL